MELLKNIGIGVLVVLGLAAAGALFLVMLSCGYTANGCSNIFG